MNESLVPITPSRSRPEALRLAARLDEVGIPSMLLPEPHPGRFRVAVARPWAREAAARLDAWADPGARPAGGAYRTAAALDEDEPLPTRRRRLAACFALGLGFGLGHVYAREYLAGALLALGQLACLALAAHGMGEVIWAFPALMAMDAFGAVAAVRRENERRRREPTAQLAATLPAVALVVASAAVWAPAPADPAAPTATHGAP
ncbi:MAG TPA: hypothetical protein RMH99_16955 [Sandaracinaceae bacterium LLY-WYZ-13_1]|nr:hypothetical protein [Sandaracinaceae bacterium LLY-WYZ-13_1]